MCCVGLNNLVYLGEWKLLRHFCLFVGVLVSVCSILILEITSLGCILCVCKPKDVFVNKFRKRIFNVMSYTVKCLLRLLLFLVSTLYPIFPKIFPFKKKKIAVILKFHIMLHFKQWELKHLECGIKNNNFIP
jgi:hypothetical protein